jgi:hypothetical protein
MNLGSLIERSEHQGDRPKTQERIGTGSGIPGIDGTSQDLSKPGEHALTHPLTLKEAKSMAGTTDGGFLYSTTVRTVSRENPEAG